MSDDRNPMRGQMADESMLRCLEAQAEAIWPQESRLIEAYGLPADVRLLDVGCGTGDFILRFATMYPRSAAEGVDVIGSHLERARRKCTSLGDRVRFRIADGFDLPFGDGAFDVAVCRHMLQSVPEPQRVVSEMMRVTRAGGRLHVLAEDYAMIHFHPVASDTDRFWHEGAIRFGEAVGADLRIGRRMFTMFHELGLRSIAVDYVVVDTLRVPREVFARTWEAWRDGFTEVIARHGRLAREEVEALWSNMIDCLRNPRGYAVWQVPVISGIVREPGAD